MVSRFIALALAAFLTSPPVVVYSRMVDNVSRGLRLATDAPTDRLGQFLIVGNYNGLQGATLTLRQVGTVTGHVWVKIKMGGIFESPVSSVLARSDVVWADAIGSAPTPVTFTWAPINISLEPRMAMIVLEGDYARSDTDYIAWHGDNRYGADAYEMNSSNVGVPSPTVDTFAHEVIANALTFRQ